MSDDESCCYSGGSTKLPLVLHSKYLVAKMHFYSPIYRPTVFIQNENRLCNLIRNGVGESPPAWAFRWWAIRQWAKCRAPFWFVTLAPGEECPGG